jgi:hypothetical protein
VSEDGKTSADPEPPSQATKLGRLRAAPAISPRLQSAAQAAAGDRPSTSITVAADVVVGPEKHCIPAEGVADRVVA